MSDQIQRIDRKIRALHDELHSQSARIDLLLGRLGTAPGIGALSIAEGAGELSKPQGGEVSNVGD